METWPLLPLSIAMSLSKHFSLKLTLVTLTLLAALAVVPRERSLRQQYAMRRLGAEIDGSVGLGSQRLTSRLFFGSDDGDRLTGLVFKGVSFSSSDAALLKLFPNLSDVRLVNCPAPERSVEVLQEARPNLSFLTITDTRLSDLRSLASLYNLRILDLQNTTVSDDSLRPISELLYLTSLDLEDTQVRGPGLRALSGLPRLDHLDLQGCPIEDGGLEYLKSFPALRYLQLQGTKVSREAVERLREALPKCDIESDYGQPPQRQDEQAKVDPANLP
jgi:Leucine-rich repeat (LRR) protein